MEWFQDLGYNEVLLLLISGIVVGIINTLGGGGSVITMALFMAMGMPVAVANGTNRIAVVMQNLSATIAFMQPAFGYTDNSRYYRRLALCY